MLDRKGRASALPAGGVAEGLAQPRPDRLGPGRLAWALSDAAVVCWMLLLALVARGPGFLLSSFGPDEGLYAVQAREWLRGGWPYVAVWDMHPPGAPALFALALALLGEGVEAVRLLGTLAVAATGYLLFRCARLAGAGRAVGLVAGLLYVAYSTVPEGASTNTELLLAPFVTAGVGLAIHGAREVLERRRAPGAGRMLGIGLCFGMALWIKSVAAPEAALAFAGLAGLALARRAAGPGRLIPLALAFALGCGLPMGATALAYALRGEFAAFFEANFVAPLLYLGTEGPELPSTLRLVLAELLQLAWLLGGMGVAVAEAVVLARRGGGRVALLPFAALLWFGAATVGILLPGKFHGHYFLMWLPPLCLGAAFGLRAVVGLLAPRLPGLALLAAAAMVASMPVLASLAGAARAGFALLRPDPPRAIAAEIRRLLPPGETAFLVNYEPVVYLLAELPLPTRMPFWQHLAGDFGNLIGQGSDAELARVLAGRPYLMVVSEENWAKVRPEAREAIEALLAAEYERAATLLHGRNPVEIWRRR